MEPIQNSIRPLSPIDAGPSKITNGASPLPRMRVTIDFKSKAAECSKLILNSWYATLLKVISFALKCFGRESESISKALTNHENAYENYKICNRFSKLNFNKIDLVQEQIALFNTIFSASTIDPKAAQYAYASCKYSRNKNLVQTLKHHLEQNQLDNFKKDLAELPSGLRNLLHSIICITYGKDEDESFAKKFLQNTPKELLNIKDNNKMHVLDQLKIMYSRLEIASKDLALLYRYQRDYISNTACRIDLLNNLSEKSKIQLEMILTKKPARQDAFIAMLRNDIEYKQVKTISDNLKNFLPSCNKDKPPTYDSSFERAAEGISLDILQQPITVAMLGVEYASFIKQGGLGEAIEGMTKALLQHNPNNKAILIFPKYNKLPQSILDSLKKSEQIFKDKNGNEISVLTCKHEGVDCFFIDHEDKNEFGAPFNAFNLDDKNPNIYGPTDKVNKKRFFTFTDLASQVVYQMKGIDIIHLHDWHVAGVALKLQKDHREEWNAGLKQNSAEPFPAVVFTFHNNNRGGQGRTYQGCYNYDSVISSLQEAGIADDYVNIFAETIQTADMVTTVSENFAKESQLPELGEGISFAVRAAAKAGKLVGVINGIDTTRWNPETDEKLRNWIDPRTKDPVDLSFSSTRGSAYEQKRQAKIQLQNWISTYTNKENTNDPKQSTARIDPNKPIISYIGRLDSYQKGMDKLDEAISSTLLNGGQFIIMGSQEDQNSTKILDKLELKYKNTDGIRFFRDQKNEKGKYNIQDGIGEQPGIGSLVRAASDFLFIPSRYEPCGLIQFEGWLFGSLVIGSKTGGLVDTIISKETNPNHFNGYLFNRNSPYGDSCSNVISKALIDWKSYSDSEKDKIIKRVMQDGKQHGWTTAPRGFSPIEKHLFVYQKAIQRVKLRNLAENPLRFVFNDHVYQIPMRTSLAASKMMVKEEDYLQEFYRNNSNDDVLLDRLYFGLSDKSRSQVPPPHAKRIAFERYKELGAHIEGNDTVFSVNAPNAKHVRVRLYNDQNQPRDIPLNKSANGFWKVKVENCSAGQKYHFVINEQIKIDPYGLSQELSTDPAKAPYSIVCKRDDFAWDDEKWLTHRAKTATISKPMNIYKVHATTWKREKNGNPLNYRELAIELAKYCTSSSYTHVELSAILEHPDESNLGCYRVTGFFAPSSRMGTIDDFKFLVNHLHKNNIGVFLDWIPAHFATNNYSLVDFDGTNQFKPSYLTVLFSGRKVFEREWKTFMFDYTKKDVREFLISSAVYWINEMHMDGLRVDAVKCMLWSELDGGSGKLFLRQFNAVTHTHCKRGAITMAEDYSGDTKLSVTSHLEGLGFDMKWNVNLRDKIFKFFETPVSERHKIYKTLPAAFTDDTFHKMVNYISHDEVKFKSLLDIVQGSNHDETYANARALLSFMMCVPGKKLNFMGNEIGAKKPWFHFLDNKQGIMTEEVSPGLNKMIKKLNKLYTSFPALWEKDDNGRDLEWLEKDDPNKKLIAYRRIDKKGDAIVCLHNLAGSGTIDFTVVVNPKKDETDTPATPTKVEPRENMPYAVPIFKVKHLPKSDSEIELATKKERNIQPTEIFNSDKGKYGGHGTDIKLSFKSDGNSYRITVPALSTVMIYEKRLPDRLDTTALTTPQAAF